MFHIGHNVINDDIEVLSAVSGIFIVLLFPNYTQCNSVDLMKFSLKDCWNSPDAALIILLLYFFLCVK